MPNRRVGWGVQFKEYAGPLGIIRDSAFWVLCRYRHSSHWTGGPGRLNRIKSLVFGSEEYAAEELVAEFGAAILCAHVGISYKTNHASYIANWIKSLKDDPKALMTAVSQAQKAVDFLLKPVAEEKIKEVA